MQEYKYKTCRAVVIERPYEANLREIKLTEPRKDAFVTKTTWSAISTGTDMKTYKGIQEPGKVWYPLVPGYENAGIIVTIPDKSADLSYLPESAQKLKVGDRVMINECREYADVCGAWGGASEYSIKDSFTASGSADYMVKIPDNVTDEQAVLAYLACVPLKGIKRLTLRDDETIVVFGAGMVGISAIQILKILNPSLKIIAIEPNRFRQGIAERFADYVFSPCEALRKIKDVTNGHMADQIIECSGDPSIPGTLHKYLKNGGWGEDDIPGHIHLQADYPEKLLFDYYESWFTKNPTISMTCALSAGCKEQILQWISEGKFDTKLPYEVWGVSECADAFRYQNDKGADCFKILFDWSR